MHPDGAVSADVGLGPGGGARRRRQAPLPRGCLAFGLMEMRDRATPSLRQACGSFPDTKRSISYPNPQRVTNLAVG